MEFTEMTKITSFQLEEDIFNTVASNVLAVQSV